MCVDVCVCVGGGGGGGGGGKRRMWGASNEYPQYVVVVVFFEEKYQLKVSYFDVSRDQHTISLWYCRSCLTLNSFTSSFRVSRYNR